MSRRPRSRADVTPVGVEIANLEEQQFGVHVRLLRRARGMTQDRLAERCDLSADTIRRLEHGAFSPSLDTLTKLCVGLQITRSTLFESFELGERDPIRELVDMLGTRKPNEIALAVRVVRTVLEGVVPDDAEIDDDQDPAP